MFSSTKYLCTGSSDIILSIPKKTHRETILNSHKSKSPAVLREAVLVCIVCVFVSFAFLFKTDVWVFCSHVIILYNYMWLLLLLLLIAFI